MLRTVPTVALVLALFAAPVGPHGAGKLVLPIPDTPLTGAVAQLPLIGPVAGDDVVHTTWDLTYTAPHLGTPASDVILALSMPLASGAVEMTVTGAQLGWPAAIGTFTASLETDALNGVLGLGDLELIPPMLTISSVNGGVTGQFINSTITLKLAGFCQKDVGLGGPGNLQLQVCGDAMGTGGHAILSVTGAPPFAPMLIVAGLIFGPTPFKGGTLVPVPRLLAIPLWAGAEGSLFVNVHGGFGPLTVYLQVAAADPAQVAGVAMSNAIQLELLP